MRLHHRVLDVALIHKRVLLQGLLELNCRLVHLLVWLLIKAVLPHLHIYAVTISATLQTSIISLVIQLLLAILSINEHRILFFDRRVKVTGQQWHRLMRSDWRILGL